MNLKTIGEMRARIAELEAMNRRLRLDYHILEANTTVEINQLKRELKAPCQRCEMRREQESRR